FIGGFCIVIMHILKKYGFGIYKPAFFRGGNYFWKFRFFSIYRLNPASLRLRGSHFRPILLKLLSRHHRKPPFSPHGQAFLAFSAQPPQP
ncbi:MAG TPA: hypothetical protein PLU97_01570, partial [Candidatus Cryptobacteroides sp.]|nr:hypothetical protein [Candidatus Cryptobacteroides sp.]